jgi:hypothetical protein
MPLINATWKVTHNGVVLLDWTDYMQDEPKLDRAFISDRVASIGAAAITNLGRLNLSHTATFSQVRVFENDDEARTYMQEHSLLISDEPAACLIEWLRTGLSDTLQDCIVTNYQSRCENNHFFASYTLLGGELTPGAFTPPPVSAGAGWRFVTVVGPPRGVTLQVYNSSSVWENVWTQVASS